MTTRSAMMIYRPAIALLLGCVLVAACYFYVDRPVAWFMHDHRLVPNELMRRSPLISDCLTYSVMAAILGIVVWRYWNWRLGRPGGRSQALLFALAVNLVATTAVKSLLKWAFGRSWPETWSRHNPSLIRDGVYGFHPFHSGGAYQSFPSGHTAATFAVISILWLSRPRWRWLYATVAVFVCVALVVLDFHFVGDVIAGAMLGTSTGVCATKWFRLRPEDAKPQKDLGVRS